MRDFFNSIEKFKAFSQKRAFPLKTLPLSHKTLGFLGFSRETLRKTNKLQGFSKKSLKNLRNLSKEIKIS